LCQPGNIKIIVIAIFILAILGWLGFVFWNNFTKQSSTNQSTVTSVKSPLKVLTINEWSIRLSYKDLPDLAYSITDDGSGQNLSFSSSAVSGCDFNGLGGVTRLDANSSGNKTAAKSINGYIYTYREPTFVDCDDINSSAIQDFVKDIRAIYLTISPIR
jgi:hypothetical protein